MIAWTDEERNKLFNYISKEHNITFDDAKFVVEESEKHSLELSSKYEDFEENLRLSNQFQQILIEFCKNKYNYIFLE